MVWIPWKSGDGLKEALAAAQSPRPSSSTPAQDIADGGKGYNVVGTSRARKQG